MNVPCRLTGALVAALLAAVPALAQTPSGGTGATGGAGGSPGTGSNQGPSGSGRTDSAHKPVLRLRAFAIDMNNPSAATSARTIDIVIERWSTDAERDRLRGVLTETGGGDALLRAVQAIKPRAGYVRTTTSLGWDIQFARQVDLPNGARRIVVGSDRPMSFWELSNKTRSSDYEFMLADIRIGPDGKGEGKLVPAAMVTYDEGTKTIEVENWDTQPVRLTQVTVVQ